ncbi:MAG: TRAP transporter substrate-binding protein DctP [Arcobacter sp.]|uniref:TRAP transporter substrate-binding protein DctP n=1 Tax=Arcobacter sp. TaxID=1872629 RepID=UPI003C71428A
MLKISVLLILSVGVLLAGDKVLKLSHQWPGGGKDVRDKMVRIVADEVEKANVGLTIKIYPSKSLYKPKEQWSALVKGRLDMTALPLDYAGGRHPEFSATLMPGLIKNHDHAKRINNSQFMKDIKKVINDAGAKVLADSWLAGGFVSTKNCILEPDDVKGQVIRAAGSNFEEMLHGAGASISSMASSEIYTALQTGVLDAANTSSGSFVSYRIYEQVKCLTAPGENALWFMYEPILISMKTWKKLNSKQQEALMKAGQKAETYFEKEAKNLDDKLVSTFKKAGVKVVYMSKEQADKWKKIAAETSYKSFATKVPNGAKLIEEARSVE